MHLALYGTVRMVRAECPNCKSMALVVRGRFACCDEPGPNLPPKIKQRRMMEIEENRRRVRPTPAVAREIVREQGNRCFYCVRSFGTFLYDHKRKKRLRLRREWDHKMPFSYAANNDRENLCAACHVCNAFKSDYVFATIEEARVFIHDRWERRYPKPPPEAEEPEAST